MAHELSFTKEGLAEMAYVGDTPWHGFGQKVERGATVDEMRAAANMTWQISDAPVEFGYSANGMKIRGKVADKKVLYRSDTFAPLSVVGAGFNVVQPEEIFEFFRDLTESAGFHIETAGALFGGRRVWALASIGDSCEIVPGDKIGGYLFLCTACDGTLATTGKYTTVRVVCNNTLTMATGEAGGYRVSHKTNFDPVVMKQKLGLVHDEFAAFSANMKRLSDKHVSAARAERLCFDLLKPADFEKQEADAKLATITKVSDSKAFRSILSLFDGGGKGSGIDGVKDTAWGFVNAVTEYTDYFSRAQSVDNRLNNAWLGAGDEMKTRAVDLALSF